ncbi:IS110 family transposase [Streptomyces sp. NBC_01240]|uniref:IS110 family transposase n=1 Tax=Streptomyces sp. NBC_01240 TaxID=2903793 RepID=UPI002E14A47C
MVGGVDTHTDFHQAAVIDTIGRHLATAPFPTTPDGYRRLLEWMRLHGDVLAVGVKGTGAYGSELARFLRVLAGQELEAGHRRGRRPRMGRTKRWLSLGIRLVGVLQHQHPRDGPRLHEVIRLRPQPFDSRRDWPGQLPS